MGDYLGLILALAIGLPLLVIAVVVDQVRRRRREAELAAPPQRDLPEVDAHAPAYVTQDEIDHLPARGAGRSPAARAPGGTALHFGHAHRDFATAGDRAELADVRVLMTNGPVDAVRELLVPLGSASRERPLVVVATSVDAEVLTTLAANRRALDTGVLVAVADEAALSELHALLGGEILSTGDLKAGYVPDSALGRATRWVSDARTTWVTPQGPGEA